MTAPLLTPAQEVEALRLYQVGLKAGRRARKLTPDFLSIKHDISTPPQRPAAGSQRRHRTKESHMNQSMTEYEIEEAISQLVASARKRGYQPLSVWTGEKYVPLQEQGTMEVVDIVAASMQPTVVFQNTEKELVEFGLDTRPGANMIRGCTDHADADAIWNDLQTH